MTLPRNSRETVVELLGAAAGSHVVGSLILLANMVQAQVLSGMSTLGDFVTFASAHPVVFASVVFGPNRVEAFTGPSTPLWSATVAFAYVTGFVVSVVAIRRVRGLLEDVRADPVDVDVEGGSA